MHRVVEAREYMDKKYWDLPEYGKFYGKSGDFNREALMAAKPQVVIDVGEWDEDYKKDLDKLQEQIGIPVVLIDGNIKENPSAFRTMGKLLGEEERGEELGKYSDEVLQDAQDRVKKIKDHKKVYVGEREDGLSTILAGTIHAQIFEMVGADVVATPEVANKQQGGGTVSLEQVLAWNPDAIFFGPDSIYDSVASDPTWSGLKAIQNGDYYRIPDTPYNWVGRPPGPNRLIGIRWVGNMLYPDVFDYDMEKEVKHFYKLMYRHDLTDEEVADLLGTSGDSHDSGDSHEKKAA
ncbi:ABC transporter substrate-binding protein [Gleimia hominis]|uniref:ABC transporter substrate-binding protein n=1 Tax=Gleimia hominis TaxID=595468 RepID=A0ABU3ICS1_9ACTO|nr:ABC transporter substrate-binding protein [Gleimia hominis]MDT3768147.1 ABC transporter substrate-binding protein [Gleimia hominis]